LATPEQLRAFLIDHHVPVQAPLEDADVEWIHKLRAELYAALGEDDAARAVHRLNALLATLAPSLQLASAGGWHWELSAPGDAGPVAHAGVQATAGVLSAIRQLGPHRLRSCANPDCCGRFVDISRAGTRRYDLPAICGNRINVAAHRARRAHQRAEREPPADPSHG
jgi:predicted RNA-binding Zn ribbon-like protein